MNMPTYVPASAVINTLEGPLRAYVAKAAAGEPTEYLRNMINAAARNAVGDLLRGRYDDATRAAWRSLAYHRELAWRTQ